MSFLSSLLSPPSTASNGFVFIVTAVSLSAVSKTGYSEAFIYWGEFRIGWNIWHASKRTGDEEAKRVCGEELGERIKCSVLKIDFLFVCLPGSSLLGSSL